MLEGSAIYCDCCGQEKMAEIKNGNLVIRDNRHGKSHAVIINCLELLDILNKNGYSMYKIKTPINP